MLTMRDCRAGYGDAPVLSDITLDIERGRVTALIGPNGCGKSTLLRMAARLVLPTAGTMALDGRDASAFSRRAYARRVAFLPQTRDVPALTVRALAAHGRYAHLSFPRRMTASDWTIVEDALALSGAAAFAERDLRALSGGERQRAYLAMALAQQGDVLLLDEPTTYLDAGCQFAILQTLRALARDGRAVLVALHDIAQALLFADRIALMQNGRLIACRATEDMDAALVERVFGVRVEWTTARDGNMVPVILPPKVTP